MAGLEASAEVIPFPTRDLYHPTTGEVLTQPMVNELVTDFEVAKDTTRSQKARLNKANRELNELLDTFAPDEEWIEFAAWWLEYTGRNGKTRVDRSSDRCGYYKKLRKHWDRREIACMVVGARNHHFAPFRDRDDMEDMAKSVKWAETCLKLGLSLVPAKTEEKA